MQQITLEKIHRKDFQSDEAFKLLRTNIQFCGRDIKVICFTSCLPNEGKSNVSFNLAISFAESGKRVIFIDADLRRSVIVGRYKPDQAVLGLTHYLSGLNTFDEVVYETNHINFDIIFSGPNTPNPAELLDGECFSELIKTLRVEYDYIIIDTPPIGSVVDSAIVSEYCDGIVFVIEANEISYRLAQKVKKQLDRGECRILGAVLNKVDRKTGQYSYYGKKYKKYENRYYIEQ